MPYTRHGHYVEHGPLKVKPQLVARCGGPALCTPCAKDVGQSTPAQPATVRDEQPLPVGNDQPVIHHLVQTDLEQRLQVGIATYGQPLQPFNGRDALRDAYEEALDLAVYLKQAMIERATPNAETDTERSKCVAHGNPDCQQCHLTRPGGLDVDGNCTDCATYGETGLHWDTCPNRAFEVYFGDDSAKYRPELNELRSAVRQVAYELEHVPTKYTVVHTASVDHNCNAAHVVDLTHGEITMVVRRLREAILARS